MTNYYGQPQPQRWQESFPGRPQIYQPASQLQQQNLLAYQPERPQQSLPKEDYNRNMEVINTN
jgi:hypothetical protein